MRMNKLMERMHGADGLEQKPGEPEPLKAREASFKKQNTIKAERKLGKKRAKERMSENGSKKHRINLVVSNATYP